MSDLTITVKYSCLPCGLHRVTCVVPARESEDVAVWMERTTLLLCADHDARSPHCHPESLTEVLIPMSGAEKVGGAPVQ